MKHIKNTKDTRIFVMVFIIIAVLIVLWAVNY